MQPFPRQSKLVPALILSLLIHGAFLAWTTLRKASVPPLPTRQPIKLRLSQVKTLKDVEGPEKGRQGKQNPSDTVSAKEKNQQDPKKSVGKSPKPSPPKSQWTAELKKNYPDYDSLLPQQDELEERRLLKINEADTDSEGHYEGKKLVRTHQWKDGLTGAEKQNLQIDAGSLHTRFDIPLVASDLMAAGRADAIVQYEPANRILTLESLTGLATLRAVLFAALSEKVTQDVIKSILESLGEKTLTIRLYLVDEYRNSESSEEYFWEDSVLQIYRYRRTFRTPPAGTVTARGLSLVVTLPDHEANRARERDKVHWDKLMTLPAYQRSLHHETLCEGC